MTTEERYQLIIRVLATQQKNNNDEDGDKHLSDAHLALEVIEEVTFARTMDDLDRHSREGWFDGYYHGRADAR